MRVMAEMLSRAHIRAALDPQVCTRLHAAASVSKLAYHAGIDAMLQDYMRAHVMPATVKLSDHACTWTLYAQHLHYCTGLMDDEPRRYRRCTKNGRQRGIVRPFIRGAVNCGVVQFGKRVRMPL